METSLSQPRLSLSLSYLHVLLSLSKKQPHRIQRKAKPLPLNVHGSLQARPSVARYQLQRNVGKRTMERLIALRKDCQARSDSHNICSPEDWHTYLASALKTPMDLFHQFAAYEGISCGWWLGGRHIYLWVGR